jgi:hypothetical protein
MARPKKNVYVRLMSADGLTKDIVTTYPLHEELHTVLVSTFPLLSLTQEKSELIPAHMTGRRTYAIVGPVREGRKRVVYVYKERL